MKIYNQIGSVERFLEMFQGVNKIKLNEAIIGNENTLVTKDSILNNAFEELKNGSLKIQNTNSQADNGESHVEVSGSDDAGNQVTFRFKTTSSQGEQDGVFSVDSAELIEFIFRNNSYNVEIAEGDKILQQFNAEHAEDMMDVVSEYVESDTGVSDAEDSLYEDAVKFIDKIPYKKGTEDMQTNKAYADQKPTNPALRVQSKELDEDMNSLLHTPGTAGTGLLYPNAKEMGVTNQYILTSALKDVGVTIINITTVGDKFRIELDNNGEQHVAMLKRNYGSANNVVNLIKKKLGLNETNKPDELQKYLSEVQDYEEDPAEEDPLAMPPDYTGDEVIDTNPEDDGFTQEPQEVDNEPIEDVSPEKREIILQAYDNLIKSGNNAPTDVEIMAAVKKLENLNAPQEPEEVDPENRMAAGKTRVYPDFMNKYLEEMHDVPDIDAGNVASGSYEQLSPEIKNQIISTAAGIVDMRLGVRKLQMPKEQYFKLVKEFAMTIYRGGLAQMNESDYPKEMEIGKEFKTKSKYPKPKKHRPKRVTSVDESTDRDRYEDVVFMQGEEADEPLEILNSQGKDAAMEYLKQWHDSGNHMGSQELGHGTEDQTYEKDGYIMSWNSRIGYIGLQYDLSQMNEEELKPEENPELTDAPEPAIEPDFDKMGMGMDKTQGYDEQGNELEGGLGDNSSPADFDPEQVSLGIKVEMEHSSDPKDAMEIVLDHLTEDPEYYTVKDSPEASAQFNAASDASGEEKPDVEKENPDVYPDGWKEMDGMFMGPNSIGNKMEDDGKTNELLGFKPHNVGDYADEGFDYANAEVGYDNNDNYQKYLKYTEMDFNNLSDQEKEEFFMLWKEFKNAETVQEEIGMEDYKGKMGDKYADAQGNEFAVSNKVNGGVSLKGQGGEKEVATGDLTLMKKLGEATDPIARKQIDIAKKTLKMPDAMAGVMGGMTKKEAVQLLIKHNIKY